MKYSLRNKYMRFRGVIVAMMFAMLPALMAQTPVLEHLADDNPAAVKYIYVSKPMLKAMDTLPELDRVPWMKQSHNFNSVELLTVGSDSVAGVAASQLRDYTAERGMELFSSVRSESHSSNIYGLRKGKRNLSELVLIKQGGEAPLSVVIIKGQISPLALKGLPVTDETDNQSDR